MTLDGLSSQQRIWVEIDWAKVPVQKSLKGNIIIKTDDDQFDFTVVANNESFSELQSFKGYIEADGYLSFNAADYTALKNTSSRKWSIVEGLDYSGKALEAFPLIESLANGDLDTLTVKKIVLLWITIFTLSINRLQILLLPLYQRIQLIRILRSGMV